MLRTNAASSAKKLSVQVLCTGAALMREHALPAFVRTLNARRLSSFSALIECDLPQVPQNILFPLATFSVALSTHCYCASTLRLCAAAFSCAEHFFPPCHVIACPRFFVFPTRCDTHVLPVFFARRAKFPFTCNKNKNLRARVLHLGLTRYSICQTFQFSQMIKQLC